MQSLMLTLCQNWICCKRSCYFPNTQPLPQNRTRDRENVLTQNILGNQRTQVSILKNDAVNGKIPDYVKLSIAPNISRGFEVGSKSF